jgi:tRNA pseudouridine55 synthase
LDGLLNINKKRGERSFEVVMKAKKLLLEKRVGHTGTLDESAAGVLVLLAGKATKIARFLVEDEKEYVGTVRLGISTDTDDSTGKVIGRGDASRVTEEAFEEAAKSFVGQIEQIPPLYSCIRVEGERMHELARRGISVKPQPRKVRIEEIHLLGYGRGEGAIRVVCSKGTYMRALARDIGAKLGCLAHLHNLVRMRVGDNLLENSIDIDSVSEIERHIVTMNDALSRYSMVTLRPREISRLKNGQRVSISGRGELYPGSVLRMCGSKGELIGVGNVREGLLVPLKILT